MKKDGWQNGKQRYKCKACGKRFDGGKRLQNDELWTAYSAGKQTAA
ncbi:IS1/IS1595 family N-terminal zinc-binding domain-containing protein [Cardiobacterium hominis]